MVIYFYHKSLNICLRVVHKYYFSKVIKPGLLVNFAENWMKFCVICLSFIANLFKIHKMFFKGDDFVSKNFLDPNAKTKDVVIGDIYYG